LPTVCSLKRELQQIEKQIYELEGTYLEETLSTGNVIVGWDGYLRSVCASTLNHHSQGVGGCSNNFATDEQSDPAHKKAKKVLDKVRQSTIPCVHRLLPLLTGSCLPCSTACFRCLRNRKPLSEAAQNSCARPS
jgi:hypothetical protein